MSNPHDPTKPGEYNDWARVDQQQKQEKEQIKSIGKTVIHPPVNSGGGTSGIVRNIVGGSSWGGGDGAVKGRTLRRVVWFVAFVVGAVVVANLSNKSAPPTSGGDTSSYAPPPSSSDAQRNDNGASTSNPTVEQNQNTQPAPPAASDSSGSTPSSTPAGQGQSTQPSEVPATIETTQDEFGCDKPVAPTPVDGSAASEADMEAAARLANSFIGISDRYQDCLNRYGNKHSRQAETDAARSANQHEKEEVGAAFERAKSAFDAKGM